jgi:flagellar protein FliO/FliZ
MQPTWISVLWFVAVVALIPLALWLLKRSPMGATMGMGLQKVGGTPRTVAMLPLSAQHKLVTVEVGQGEERVWLVLGLSPQGLSTVHTMTPGSAPVGSPSGSAAEAPGGPPPQTAFAQLLGRMRKPGDHAR